MHYLLDTNILIHRIRQSQTGLKLEEHFGLFSGKNTLIISAVTKGEILAFAKQTAWGMSKINKLMALLDSLACFPIDGASPLMDAYADIDSYSQGKHPEYLPPKGFTSRNMGKNDIWIAATAFLLDIPLLTMDNDFDHLHPNFIQVIKI